MKRLFIYILLSVAVAAQAATLDNRAVVRILTYTPTDTLAQGYGFFTSSDGEVLVPYSLMKGATRAEVVDWKGVAHPVTLILGASSNYDVVRLRCEARKMAFLPVSQAGAAVGEGYQQLYYTTSKKAQPEPASVVESSPFEEYTYMSVSTPNEDRYMGCPIVNAAGEVVGIIQRNLDKKATSACAIDARFSALSVGASSALNSDLRAIRIARDIPATEDDAFSYLYMLHRMTADSTQFVSASRLFAERFPHNTKGYTETAYFWSSHRNYAEADRAISAALALGTEADEVHSAFSDIIYEKALQNPETPYKDWTLERALQESETAFSLRPDTAYLVQQGNCLYGLERYREAHDRFLQGATYSHRPAELYLYAATALERAKGDSLEVIALLDKAVESCSRPFTAQAAPYLFARAQHLEAVGQYRAAVRDYNEYEKAVGSKNLTDRFYNIRQAAEQNARMYQQAIDDLRTAASIATDTEARGYYLLEVAAVYLWSDMPEEAREAAQEAARHLPADNADLQQIFTYLNKR